MPETLRHRIERLAPHFTLVRPEGEGPYPLVIQMHGCGGRKPFMNTWAEIIRDAGACALIVDSFAPRRISTAEAYATVCTGLRLRGRERAGDFFAAMAYARTLAGVDPTRIIAAGWSHGGWTLLDGLALRMDGEAQRATGLEDLPDEPLAGLAGAFILYPYVGPTSLAGRRPWRVQPRATAIVGGKDAIVGAKAPREAMLKLHAAGMPIDTHFFETATHAFDEPEARHPQVRYDAGLTRRAHDLLRDLIAQVR